MTCAAHAQLNEDDRLVIAPLAAREVDVLPVIWTDADTDLRGVDALVLRSTWDYIDHFPAFTSWLGSVEASGIPLHNPLSVVRWNVDKRYLLELEARGVPIVPTVVLPAPSAEELVAVLDRRGWKDAVVKPTVSCGAKGLRRIVDAAAEVATEIAAAGVDVLVQPFAERVVRDGELSFVFFRGVFSHAVRKRPPAGDFRAQEHLGGKTVVEPDPSPRRIEIARAALEAMAFSRPPLYARVDVLEDGDGLLLMELELVEPLLYMAHAPGAEARFADAITTELGTPR